MVVFMVGLLKMMKKSKIFELSATRNITMYAVINTDTTTLLNGKFIALRSRSSQDLKIKLKKKLYNFLWLKLIFEINYRDVAVITCLSVNNLQCSKSTITVLHLTVIVKLRPYGKGILQWRSQISEKYTGISLSHQTNIGRPE